MNRVGRVTFCTNLLMEGLGLPEDTVLLGAKLVYGGGLELTIHHPELRDVPEGAEIPELNLTFRTLYTRKMVSWGQEEE